MNTTQFDTLHFEVSAVKGMILPSRSAPVD